MKAIGEKQVEVKGPGAGWWWILVSQKNQSCWCYPDIFLGEFQIFFLVNALMNASHSTKITTFVATSMNQSIFAGKISMYCWSKKIFAKCACPHNPPPSGKILSWLNLTQNPGWIGSFLKWGKSVPPISKKVPKKGADSQVVNLKRELSEQGDSIEDDKRAGQAVKVQTFYVVLVEFRDNTLGTNKIICKNMFFTMLNDVYFLVFWGISVHIWKLRICCWP